MRLAQVQGNVIATVKDPGLDTRKLLIIQPQSPTGKNVGSPLIAVDAVGVGAGERVFFVRGREASFPFLPDKVPTDACIVGRVDTVQVTREQGARAQKVR